MMSISRAMGEPREVRLSSGSIRYREVGSGPAILFVHGLLVNGDLWRSVVPRLSNAYRCIVPDWPLGSHASPMDAHADLSLPGLARIVVDFIDTLELRPVTLVGNDTGGAICQLVATRSPDRVSALVLTNCDAFDQCFPPLFRYLQWGAKVPGFAFALSRAIRNPVLRELGIAYGALAKHARSRESAVWDSYALPASENRDVRRDLTKVLRGVSSRYTLDAAKEFARFDKPVLIAWAPEDQVFSLALGRRLADAFPRARLETVLDSYAFVPEDRPDRLSALIAQFVS